MKRLFLTLLVVGFFSSSAMAFNVNEWNIYIEGKGFMEDGGAASWWLGGGGGLGFTIDGRLGLGFQYRGGATADPSLNWESSLTRMGVYIEYRYPLPKLPLAVRAAVGVDFMADYYLKDKSHLIWIMDPYSTTSHGLEIYGAAGIEWWFHPHLSLIFDIGFHYQLTGEYDNSGGSAPSLYKTVYGMEASLGVRLYIMPIKRVDTDYL